MADVEFTDDVTRSGTVPDGSHGSVRRFINVLGAGVSLALVAGIGVWSYELIQRDISGIPVVRALEGPMRVQPDNPGGRPADHQGLAVNTVAAEGTAAETADRLMLAPRPVSLTDEDVPMRELAPQSLSTRPVPRAEPAPAPEPEAAAIPVSAEAKAAFQDGSIDALVRELTDGVAPLSGETVEEPEAVDPAELLAANAELQVEAAVLEAPGVRRSPRPQIRPASFTPPALAVPEAAAATLDVDPQSVPAGTRLAQLGAYESPEIARDEWDRLAGRFGDYLENKSRVIQQASSGGRTFYRLRAMGFDDISDARRFCSALVAEGADCIPVTTR